MDKLPPEILHSICALLQPAEIRSIRLVDRKLSLIGSYYLISAVSFYLSAESLERLHQISLHPILCQQVKSLHYQANVLQEIKTVPMYKEVMNGGGHRHERRPEPPGAESTDRERRLYIRNEAKWRRGQSDILSTQQIRKLIRSYTKICEKQQEDIKTGLDRTILREVIARFPNLKHMTYTARPTCCHGFSERFMERFKDLGITPPTSPDTSHSVNSLVNYLAPLAGSKIELDELYVCHVSPEFLRMPKFNIELTSIKTSLATITDCKLSFKLDAQKSERLHQDGGEQAFAVLKDGGLPMFLASMPQLQSLWVAFEDCPCQTKVPLDRILGDHEWPDLFSLTLGQFSATEDELLDCLTRHVDSLVKISFDNANLTKGSWLSLTYAMRKDLALEDAAFHDTLRSEAFGEHWDMRSLNIDALDYLSTLSDDLNVWICSGPDDDEDMEEDLAMDDSEDWLMSMNPLMDTDLYVDPDDIDASDMPLPVPGMNGMGMVLANLI